jgi:hypothetical protein
MNPDDMPDNSARIRAILGAAGLRYEDGCAVSPSGLFDPIEVGHIKADKLIEGLIYFFGEDRFEAGEEAARAEMRAALGL